MAKGLLKLFHQRRKHKKDAEWDIDAIREGMQGKKIVFCLPGRGVSYVYLKNFVQLCFDLVQNGMSIQISQDYSSMVNFARCKCLGANVLRVIRSDSLGRKARHDYQLWIDSDIVFTSEKFWQLCDLAINAEGEEKEIVAAGTPQKMDRLLPLHTGWKKMTSVRTVR